MGAPIDGNFTYALTLVVHADTLQRNDLASALVSGAPHLPAQVEKEGEYRFDKRSGIVPHEEYKTKLARNDNLPVGALPDLLFLQEIGHIAGNPLSATARKRDHFVGVRIQLNHNSSTVL